MNSDIPDIGDIAPDFELLSSGGSLFRLNDLLNSGRTVKIVFYRGHW